MDKHLAASPAISRAAEATDAQLVALGNKLMVEHEGTGWKIADVWATLASRGWSQNRIAEANHTSQPRVSRYIRCANNYAHVHNRPSFYDALQEVNSVPEVTSNNAPAVPTVKDARHSVIADHFEPEPVQTRPEPTRREPGDETARPRAAPQGRTVFEFAPVMSDFGKCVRHLDELGNAFRCKEAADLEEARQLLGRVLAILKARWQEKGK